MGDPVTASTAGRRTGKRDLEGQLEFLAREGRDSGGTKACLRVSVKPGMDQAAAREPEGSSAP